MFTPMSLMLDAIFKWQEKHQLKQIIMDLRKAIYQHHVAALFVNRDEGKLLIVRARVYLKLLE